MIIEFKDIPEGTKIKQIEMTVDFENDTVIANVETKKPKTDIGQREKKQVPEEMLDGSF